MATTRAPNPAQRLVSWPHIRGAVGGKSVRRALIGLGVLIALIVIVRLILDPIATHQTRKALNQLEGFRGDFERVHVTIFGPGYDITHLKIVEVPRRETKEAAGAGHAKTVDVDGREPLVYVKRAHVGVDWHQLLHLRLMANLRLEDPKLIVKGKAAAAKPKEERAGAAPDLSEQLYNVTALKIDRIQILGGELLYRGADPDAKQPQELWIHNIEAVAQNIATRASLSNGRPATVSAHAKVGRSGDLDIFVSADPFASPLAFAGQVALKGLKATELYAFVEPAAHMQTSEGIIDVFAEFVSKDGLITGGVKPVLKNIEIRPTDDGVWNRMKAWFADKSVELASDRVPGRNAIATTIPIKGKLTDPDVQLWPAILGVIRNAFVQGLSSGFRNVPPPTADEKQGAFEQAKNALTKEHGPPLAQPADVPKEEPSKGAANEAKEGQKADGDKKGKGQ